MIGVHKLFLSFSANSFCLFLSLPFFSLSFSLFFSFFFFSLPKKMDEEKKSENEKLIEAVAEGDEGLVKVLLHNKNQKLNVNFQDKNGETALHKAMKGWEGIVKLLVAHGSNIDLQDQVLIF